VVPEKEDMDELRPTDGLKPEPPQPLRAGLRACAYTLAAFGVFWFVRATGLPELLAALVGLAASFAAGWFDCTLAWQPYQQADHQAPRPESSTRPGQRNDL
jgi:hypothetical protein